MSEALEQFKNTWLGKKIGDGQCVPAQKQELLEVNDFLVGAWGNAVDYANATNQARFAAAGFEWRPGEQNRVDDDVLVWGDDPGNFTSEFGHIATAYHGNILNQNNTGRHYVTIDNYFSPGFIGLYRKKENNMIPEADLDLVRILFTEIEGADYNKTHSGGDDDLLRKTYINNPNVSIQTLIRNMFHGPAGTAYRAAKVTAFQSLAGSDFEEVTYPVYKKK